MSLDNKIAIISSLDALVALYEKELAANADFLKQNGKLVSQADKDAATELKAKIASLKASDVK
jgi:hypothetical protein